MTSLFGLPELAEASSSLSVSASDSSATYVENDHTPAPRERDHDYSGQTLKDFFAQNHRSPPDKLHGGNIHLRVVIQSCNKLLCPRNISWQNLDRDQQIKMAFLYSRRQEKWIKKHLHKVKMTAKARELMADMLLKALDPTTREGQRLEAFVRKGGDLVLEPAANDEDHYEQFLDKFPAWKNKKSTTIFNKHHFPIKPLYRFQHDSSSLCYVIASANLIFYSWCMTIRSSHNDALQLFALNVNRLMRNIFSDEHIFRIIFLGAGGNARKVLTDILQPQNSEEYIGDFLHHIDIDAGTKTSRAALHKCLGKFLHILDDPKVLALLRDIETAFQDNGPLLIEHFMIFTEFVIGNELTFAGSLDNYHPTGGYHSLLVVGIRKSCHRGMGGLEFLVQNSWDSKPFAIVGLTLLRSMNITRLLSIRPGLNFRTPGNNKFPLATRTIHSGSPRNDVQCLNLGTPNRNVESQWTANESQYYHEIDPNRPVILYSL